MASTVFRPTLKRVLARFVVFAGQLLDLQAKGILACLNVSKEGRDWSGAEPEHFSFFLLHLKR